VPVFKFSNLTARGNVLGGREIFRAGECLGGMFRMETIMSYTRGVTGDVRPADSTTLAAATSAAVAAFDADIARAAEERAAAVQRAAEAGAAAPDTYTDDEVDDDQGELTLGQLVVDRRSDVWNESQLSLVNPHGKVRRPCS